MQKNPSKDTTKLLAEYKEFEQLLALYGNSCKYYGVALVHSQGYPCKREFKEVQDLKKRLLDVFLKTLKG